MSQSDIRFDRVKIIDSAKSIIALLYFCLLYSKSSGKATNCVDFIHILNYYVHR